MAKNNLKQTAYHKIRENIINCKYAPGSILNEDMLCQELQMSRTPVRDAIGRLEQEQLVRILPKKGIYVVPFTVNDIMNVYEGRILLEPYIMRTYCQHLRPDIIERLKEIIKEEMKCMDENATNAWDLDKEFHHLILSQCQNPYLMQLNEQLQSQNSRIRILSAVYSNERFQDTFDEHAKIFYELSLNHVDAAAAAMEEHLVTAREASLTAYMKGNSFL